MNKYKIVKLTKPMSVCGDLSTYETFNNAKELYDFLNQEYISKPLTRELAYSGGLYAVISLDQDDNYKSCEIVLELLNNRIHGYHSVTAADELKISKFLGIE